MNKKERQEWLKSAERCFNNPDCSEECMWRWLFRWASGYEYLHPNNLI